MRTKRATSKYLIIETAVGTGILNLWTDDIIAIIKSRESNGSRQKWVLAQDKSTKHFLDNSDLGRELIFQDIIPSIDFIDILFRQEDIDLFNAIREQ